MSASIVVFRAALGVVLQVLGLIAGAKERAAEVDSSEQGSARDGVLGIAPPANRLVLMAHAVHTPVVQTHRSRLAKRPRSSPN